jgi:inhibitor of KinA sporulation pathway (predicted exonuclease)
MHLIVFDLEWNCAGKANKVDRSIQDVIPFEIIEIGAVKLTADYQVIGKFSVQIRPRLYPILTGAVAAVTRRGQQSMRYGLDFPAAARSFFDFCGEDYLFCTWSESDTATLLMNLRYYGLADRLEVACLDVQYVFDRLVEQADMQRSIEYAVDFLDLPKSQPFHQAVTDAWYTGQILARIARLQAEENGRTDFLTHYAFDPNLPRSYQYTISGLATIEALLTELRQSAPTCPACGLPLQPEDDWNRAGNRVTAAFCCPEHGRVTGKSRLRRKGPEQLLAAVSIRIDKEQDNR